MSQYNIILWINNEPNQIALACRIYEKYPVKAIVFESRRVIRKITLKKIVEKLIEKLFLPQIDKAWFGLLKYYNKKYPELPEVSILNVENINSADAYEFTRKFTPDLIVVSGTRIIKNKMLSIKPQLGIINLHTGLSPYIKGGPNCTNWCIANNEFHLIGNTVMWIDEGIDTGNIIKTDFVELTDLRSLYEIHFNVMEHAHTIYINAIEAIVNNKKVSNVKQNTICEGLTYYNKDWNLKKKINLMKNCNLFLKGQFDFAALEQKKKQIDTVSLYI